MNNSWQDVRIALVVCGAELDPVDVTTRFGLHPTIAAAADSSRIFRDGAGIWILTEACTPDSSALAAQLSVFQSSITAQSSVIKYLKKLNYTVEIVVSGRVTGIQSLLLTPEALRACREIGLEVSFTVRRAPSESDLFFQELLSDPPLSE